LNSKTGNGNAIPAHRKPGESADLYDESIILMDSRYKNRGGYDIHALNPPPVYPLAGRVTVLSLDDDGGGQAATVLVTVNDKANEEYFA
jgi:hypothetical protein